jgi:hypothetical protein
MMQVRSTQAPKYDIRANPVYQVDWNNEASGKRLSATKRRVRWRFGFSNKDAIANGLSGVDCRGEEHEIVLVWSLTSGKRLVIADGQEVHFSMGRRTDQRFETCWSMFGGHMFKIVAHAAPPLFNEPGFRQFDFQIDGMSFFSFPQIFQLGAQSGRHQQRHSSPRHFAEHPASAPRRSAYQEYSTHPMPITPESTGRRVVQAEREHIPSPPVFVDVLSEPNPTPAGHHHLSSSSFPQLTYEQHVQPQQPPVQAVQQQHQHQHYGPPPTAYGQQTPPQQYQQATPQQYQQMQPPPHVVVDEFAPVAPPPATFQDVSNQILSAYAPDPAVLALTYTPHYSEQAYQTSSAMVTEEEFAHEVTPDKPQKPVLKPTMEPISIVEMEERDQPEVSAMQKAVLSLVNLDDITEVVETPEQARAARMKKTKQQSSKPLPPSKPVWHLGFNPKLGDIKETAQPKATPQKEIMRTHAFDPAAAQAGMMVLYGATLPPSSGFGAGVHQSHYNHNPHQHRMHAAY